MEYTDKQLIDDYLVKLKSIPQIAKEHDTYPNKIRRRLLKCGVQIRDKSESQKIALEKGIAKHPTEGTTRDAETKLKISNSLANAWENHSKEKKKEILEKMAKSWEKRDKTEVRDMKKKAFSEMNKSGKTGSKLERFLFEKLREMGYNVLAHKKGLIANSNLEPDLVLPDIKLIIEIDGPMHFFPLFGQEKLDKTIAADNEKNGLFLQEGFCILRVKHICKTLSQFKKRKALSDIVEKIEEIKKNHTNTILDIEV